MYFLVMFLFSILEIYLSKRYLILRDQYYSDSKLYAWTFIINFLPMAFMFLFSYLLPFAYTLDEEYIIATVLVFTYALPFAFYLILKIISYYHLFVLNWKGYLYVLFIAVALWGSVIAYRYLLVQYRIRQHLSQPQYEWHELIHEEEGKIVFDADKCIEFSIKYPYSKETDRIDVAGVKGGYCEIYYRSGTDDTVDDDWLDKKCLIPRELGRIEMPADETVDFNVIERFCEKRNVLDIK